MPVEVSTDFDRCFCLKDKKKTIIAKYNESYSTINDKWLK